MKTRSVLPQPATPQPASGDALAHLTVRLTKLVGQRLTREFRECLPMVLIHRALNDAAEVARSTDFPHLFFPVLAEEKVRLVSAALCDEPAPGELFRSAA